MDLCAVKDYNYNNWAKTFNCFPKLFWEPSDRDELKEIFKFAREKTLKVALVGSQSSPSDLPCTIIAMISMRKFNKIISINKSSKTAIVEGGVVFLDFQEELAKNDLAFPTLPSINFMTVAGAVSTGTHGNGISHSNLASRVISAELMLTSGEIITVTQGDELMDAVRVSLGLLGAILSLEFQLVDAFNVCETTTLMNFNDGLQIIKTIPKRSEFSKLVYYAHSDTFVIHDMGKTKDSPTVKNYAEQIYDITFDRLIGKYFFAGLLVFNYYLPMITPYVSNFIFNTVHKKEQRRVDRSDKIFNFDCMFSQYVTEYSFRIELIRFVLVELRKIIESEDLLINFPIEIRFVKGDTTYLSQTHGHDCAIINIGSYCPLLFKAEKEKFWILFEELMQKVEGRPHWAKTHRLGPEDLRKLYPKFDEFLKVKQRLDPEEIICNDYYLRHFKGTIDARTLSFYP